MKAWKVYGFGDMRLEEVAVPRVRPGWVRLRVRVVQPSITEILLFRGIRTFGFDKVESAFKDGGARLFGHEFSAVVDEVSQSVSGVSVGDRVTVRGSDPSGIVGFDFPGAFSEYVLVPAGMIGRLPDEVDDHLGAAIQPTTDAVAAVDAADVRFGDTVVVIGQGAMGLAALQVARVAGAGRTIAIARRIESLELSTRLGADVTVDASSTDPVEAVLEATNGEGADVVIDAAGGPQAANGMGSRTLRQAAQMARNGGRIVGIAFEGNGTLLPYDLLRFRDVIFRFPTPLTDKLFTFTIQIVAERRILLDCLITHVLHGLESLPEALELTADKRAHGLLNPAQVIVSL